MSPNYLLGRFFAPRFAPHTSSPCIAVHDRAQVLVLGSVERGDGVNGANFAETNVSLHLGVVQAIEDEGVRKDDETADVAATSETRSKVEGVYGVRTKTEVYSLTQLLTCTRSC